MGLQSFFERKTWPTFRPLYRRGDASPTRSGGEKDPQSTLFVTPIVGISRRTPR